MKGLSQQWLFSFFKIIFFQRRGVMTFGNYYSKLYHHGIKGQKWGVRNGPPYPLDKSGKHDTIIKDAIASGAVSKKINREKQLRHTKHGHTPGRSYIDGDLEYAQKLVDKLSGTGTPIRDKHWNWTHQERVEDPHIIGTHLDRNSGIETRTNKAVITYSKTGSHIYPAKRKGKNNET